PPARFRQEEGGGDVDMFRSPEMIPPAAPPDEFPLNAPPGLGAAFVKGPLIPTARTPESTTAEESSLWGDGNPGTGADVGPVDVSWRDTSDDPLPDAGWPVVGEDEGVHETHSAFGPVDPYPLPSVPDFSGSAARATVGHTAQAESTATEIPAVDDDVPP